MPSTSSRSAHHPNTTQSYFVEFNEVGAISQAAITEYNMGSYTPLALDPLVMRMHPGRATLEGTQDGGTKVTTMTGGSANPTA